MKEFIANTKGLLQSISGIDKEIADEFRLKTRTMKNKIHPREKGKWIIEKWGMLPYYLVHKNKNKMVRKMAMFVTLFWCPFALLPFIPFFLYNMIETILYDA